MPPQSTTEPFVKFAPLTVNVKPPDPTIAELGERLATVGSGPGGKIRNGRAADTCAPVWLELSTVMLPCPGVISREASMAAVNWVGDTNVVGCGD